MEFPFKAVLSLHRLFDYWEQESKQAQAPLSDYASNLLQIAAKDKELMKEDPSLEYLLSQKSILDQLVSHILPAAYRSEQIVALFKPFSMDHFYGTPRFYEILEKSGGLMNMSMIKTKEEMLCTKTMMAYFSILEKFYGISTGTHKNLFLQTKDENGLDLYYKLGLNPEYCDINLKGELPDLSEEEIDYLIKNAQNPEIWYEKLPPSLFEFKGFAIYSMTDATKEQLIVSIKELLLTEGDLFNEVVYQLLEQKIKSLLGLPKLRFGFYTVGNGQNLRGYDSLIHRKLYDVPANQLPEPFYNILAQVKRTLEPFIASDTSKSEIFSGYKHITESKIASMMVIPAIQNDELFGMFAFASEVPNEFNTSKFLQLEEVLPLLNLAIKRNLEAIENHIQNEVKQNYTSIHPSVEWKFREAALDIINRRNEGQPSQPGEIVFENVYPLFAASDIRNSSIIRNTSITEDLLQQLKHAKKILLSLKEVLQIPVVGELIHKVSRYSGKLRKGLYTGDESNIVNFLKTEVEHFFKTIQRDFPDYGEPIEQYWKMLDPEMRIVNNKRRGFENSLNILNEKIAKYLNVEHEKNRAVFPHYFELFKTDGVEYNMYIGQSISKERKFNRIYLKNMRLWQLLATVEVARIAEEAKKDLETPLDMTHLILAHSDALSIRFRLDEKNFDVDGAYNIRYEIVKKRIDKVHIKGTEERLTQPGKIAVVYSKDDEETEYLEYLDYLRHKGAIGQEIEKLELEELQGVYGLKALRVSIEVGAPSFEKEIQAIKASS